MLIIVFKKHPREMIGDHNGSSIGIILPLSSLLTKWFTTRQIITTGIGALSLPT